MRMGAVAFVHRRRDSARTGELDKKHPSTGSRGSLIVGLQSPRLRTDQPARMTATPAS